MNASPRRVCLVVLAVALAGCRDREEKEPAREPPAPAPEVSEPASAACTDWSVLPPSDLPPLPASPFAKLLDEVWWRVAQKHHDPTLGCLDWKAVRGRYGERLVGVDDAAAAYAVIGEMLGELEQSHFRLFPPAADEEAAGSATPALKVRWIDDTLVVVESAIDAVPQGAAIAAIGELATTTLVEQARARHPASESGLAFEIARLATTRLSCPRSGSTRSVTVEPFSAAPESSPPTPRRVEVRCELPDGDRVTLGHLVDIPTRVRSRILPGRIGYLAFNIWMVPMVDRVTRAVQELQRDGIDALIIDLRGNPGGVGPMAVPIARLILREDANLGTLRFRDFNQTFNVAGNPNAFEGPVVILLDEGTASTSEIFAMGLRDIGRVELVAGQRSAGAALPSVIEELPGGAILQYVVGTYRSPRGAAVEGQGLEPDLRVSERRADFAAGRDPVLQAAIEHLRAKRP